MAAPFDDIRPTSVIAAAVDEFLRRNRGTEDCAVTRLTLRDRALIVHFGPQIEGRAVDTGKTCDLDDLFAMHHEEARR